jgi:NhaP-type Na+/H+ or K+/H+ antiporter
MHGGPSPELLAALTFGILVLAFALASRALARRLITAPLAFVAAGALLGFLNDPLARDSLVSVKVVAELTLVLILFHDAAQVRPREIGDDRWAIVRLLLIGFPLTVVLGYVVARGVFPELPAMMALLLAAALAPTDAGLGAPTVLNPRVPIRVRRLLNVESGLNDGLATPVVLFAIAAVAGQEGLRPAASLADAMVDLGLGVAVGVGWGALGGILLGRSRRARWSTPASRSLAIATLPLLAYGSALLVTANGFVAAFIAGTAFAGTARWIHHEESALELTEALADPLGYAVWLVFGFVAVPLVWSAVGARELLFALLALTLLRMGPVALSLIGTGLRPRTWLFIGWFGPRGLASVVFALIAVESLEGDAALRTVLATISVTVLLSVLLHGTSAPPAARRYGRWAEQVHPEAEMRASTEPRVRGGLLAGTSSRGAAASAGGATPEADPPVAGPSAAAP